MLTILLTILSQVESWFVQFPTLLILASLEGRGISYLVYPQTRQFTIIMLLLTSLPLILHITSHEMHAMMFNYYLTMAREYFDCVLYYVLFN